MDAKLNNPSAIVCLSYGSILILNVYKVAVPYYEPSASAGWYYPLTEG